MSAAESYDRIAHVVQHVRTKGVRLWTENGNLRYRAPKGALTEKDLTQMQMLREQIVAFLKNTEHELFERPLARRQPTDSVPLTYAQQSRWHLFRLHECNSRNPIAHAIRIHSYVDRDLLQESLVDVVRRHEALRTRIVIRDGAPFQEVLPAPELFELETEDLKFLSSSEQNKEVQRAIEQTAFAPINLSIGALFRARLLQVSDDENILVLAIDHMVSDAYSMHVLLRDLIAIYSNAAYGHTPNLADVPIQFADYAIWQRRREKAWLHKHEMYWRDHLLGCPRLKFPSDPRSDSTRTGWATLPLRIGKDLKAELNEWRRARRTTLALTVFTAYAALLLRWCNAEEAVIPYQSDGRLSPLVSNTIGYFASPIYLRIKLVSSDSFLELLERIVHEYSNAVEHADFSYWETQAPQPEFLCNSLFNWVPEQIAPETSGESGASIPLKMTSLAFEYAALNGLELDYEPALLLYDTADDLSGGVYFPKNRFTSDFIEKFSEAFFIFIHALLTKPDSRVRNLPLAL